MKKTNLSITGLLVTLLLFAFTSQIFAAEPLIPDEKTRTALVNYLDSICQWIIKADLRSGELKITEKRRTSIFINSNLGRILVAGYEITGKQEYLEEALLWFDRLVSLQQITIASNDCKAGWWGDFTANDNIYLGDAGTSATALATIVRYSEGERREKYMQALKLYANFVIYGTKEDPQGKNRGGSNGWIIREGENAGAIGCGYYKGELSLAPYTISTSVTGAAFFSCIYKLTGNREYLEIAENAVQYLLKIRDPFGEFPYILHNFQLDEWPLDTMSYMADGIVSCYLNSDNQEFKKSVGKAIARSIQWLLNRQNKDGVWGELRSEDQQRSQGVLNMLVWYYHDIAHYPQIASSIRANYNFFLNAKNSKNFGVMELPITTGFVGLGIAEVIEPGITYRLVRE